jgi:dTDP-4-dehydrorhamnose 3,5-epimerase
MQIETLDIHGLVVLTPGRFGDDRGWFSESWNARRMTDAGLDVDFCQDNHSLSRDPGTLRGLHYQSPPFAQTKLVRCVVGRIFDVAVDARSGSPTYGQWRGVTLSAANGRQLLIPKGCLHGFLTLDPDTEVQYKVDAFYSGECDGAIVWDDPDIGIDWPVAEAGVGAPNLSAKDANAPQFADFISPFEYQVRGSESA